MIEFLSTPDEAQSAALAVVSHYKSKNYEVEVEIAVTDDVRFRPTITAVNRYMRVIVEALKEPQYDEGLKDLVRWAAVNRMYGEIYIATGPEVDFKPSFLSAIKRDGIGVLLVDEQGQVNHYHRAKNPALMIASNPSLALGKCKGEVEAEIQRFNDGERKPALQQMCEIVERETDKLVRKAARKQWLNADEKAASKMLFANQIDVLTSDKSYRGNRKSPLSEGLKSDLNSFRSVRNLVSHKARTKKEEREREKQFVERMMMGPRLIEAVLKLNKAIK